MKKFKIEYKSIWVKNQTFETDNIKTAIDICEDGINQQYLVYINEKKYKEIRNFGKSINLDDI
jgi:hypothetical protein